MAKSYRRIEAVIKAIEILEFLAKQGKPVSGPDIARAVGVPVGTVMCHLATMEDKNFIRFVGGCFELGLGAAILWASLKNSIEGRMQKDQSDLARLETGGM